MIHEPRQRICRERVESSLDCLPGLCQCSLHTIMKLLACFSVLISLLSPSSALAAKSAGEFSVTENDDQFVIRTSALEAVVRKRGYVTGVFGGTFLDRKTGFRDAGYGLDIVDWIMEPGSDETYREQLSGDLAYQFNNLYHGKR